MSDQWATEGGDSEELEWWQEYMATLDDVQLYAEYLTQIGKRGKINRTLHRTTGRGFQVAAKRETLSQCLRQHDRAIARIRFELQTRGVWKRAGLS